MRKTRLSAAVLLLSATFLSTPTIAVSLTPTLGENSTFSYNEGSAGDYNFTLKEADADGKLTTKYYKVDLKPEIFATSPRISWTAVSEDQKDAADVVEIKLPNDQTKYFKYAYVSLTGDELVHKEPLNFEIESVGSTVTQSGGTAINNTSDYGNLEGKVFSENEAVALVKNARYFYLQGGSVYNSGSFGSVAADFIGNSVVVNAQNDGYMYAQGGAIYNAGHIASVNGDFAGNFADDRDTGVYLHKQSYSQGGAIYNVGTIDEMNSNFVGNYTSSSGSSYYFYSQGGAISNSGVIGNVVGHFIGNYAYGSNTYSNTSYFSGSQGGAIYNTNTMGNISGDFIGNYAYSSDQSGESGGGAVYNTGTIGNISGDFIGNYAYSSNPGSTARGGAVSNGNKTINGISGNFIGNYVYSANSEAEGGAIYNVNRNQAAIGDINGSFLNNYAQTLSDKEFALGGAIHTNNNLTFFSDKNTNFLSGNYTLDKRGKIYNAIFINIPREGKNDKAQNLLTLKTGNEGKIVINDNIVGAHINDKSLAEVGISFGEYALPFNLTLTGDDTIDADTGTTTQYVAINNDIINAGTVTVNGTTLRFGAFQHEDRTAKNWDGKGAFVASLNADGTANRDAAAVTSLSLNNGVFDIANGYQETVKLKGYSATDSFMHIDVDPDNMSADMLNVNGNVEGVTKLIVHASSDADIRGKGEILFAQSENDTTGNAGSFVVSRVYKSPYLFDVNYTQLAANNNKWGLVMNDQPNEEPKEPEKPDVPDVPDVPTPPTPELPDIPPVKPQPLPGSDRPVAPEVIGAESLPAAGLAQTSNMIYNIMQKVSSNRFYCPGCGFYDYYWNGEAFHNLWANAVYNTLRIKTPTDIDADIWGIEAGGDLQHDLNNKLGLFLSYRKGNYDMNGDGKHHYSTIGSEIDIDSYLAGLYYRYDRNHWWTFATVYGGIQKVDLKTKDGIKSDTDGTEFGGSVELGYDYAINKTVYLTPSVGAFYTQVDYDDATDSAGKIAKYNTLRQLELEAGVKLTKAFVIDEGYANVYVKPSVVRTIADGDEVRITGLGKVNTLEDQTLGRVEIGGRYGFTEQLSAYGWANHTFGDDYKASTFGLGLSYNW